MVNVFDDSVASGPGNLQMAKKVVVTKGKFKDYVDEIRQSYGLGSTPYRLHTRIQMVHLLLPIVFIVGDYILDDVATMEIGGRQIETDTINSKLIYFVKSGGGSGVALQGDRGPSGSRALKGNSGDHKSVEVEVQLENVALKDLEVLLERLAKWDLSEVKAVLEHVVIAKGIIRSYSMRQRRIGAAVN